MKELEPLELFLIRGYWVDFDTRNKWDASLYTKKQAEEIRKTLLDCEKCINCSNCTDCISCRDCIECVECTACKKCLK